MITPHIMKNVKKIIPVMMAAALTCTSLPMVAKADSSKVVTLGANLSEEQKASMYKYFGTTADKVDTIEVTNTGKGLRPKHRSEHALTAVLTWSRPPAAVSRSKSGI